MTDTLDLVAVERRLDDWQLWNFRPTTTTRAWLDKLLPAARLVLQQARECEGCGGTGKQTVTPADGIQHGWTTRPCSRCAPARAALAAIVGVRG